MSNIILPKEYSQNTELEFIMPHSPDSADNYFAFDYAGELIISRPCNTIKEGDLITDSIMLPGLEKLLN